MQAVAATIWSNYVEVASGALSRGHWQTARTMYAAALNEAENVDVCVNRQITSLHGLACAEAFAGAGWRSDSGVHLRKAFRLACQYYCNDTDRLASIACLLADHYLDRGETAKALPVLKSAMGKMEAQDRLDVRDLVPILKRMALVYSTGGRTLKADQCFMRALAIEGGL